MFLKRKKGDKIITKLIKKELEKRRIDLVRYNTTPKRIRLFDLAQQNNLDVGDAFNLWTTLQHCNQLTGDMAECGVYQGDSAEFICNFKEAKILHLFDTFKGMPARHWTDEEKYYEGRFEDTSAKAVRERLNSWKDVKIYVGQVQKTLKRIEDIKFSFVNLDMDIHLPTQFALEFFYPRMTKGGIIMLHDYIHSVGVRIAVMALKQKYKIVALQQNWNQLMIIKTD